jgi:hypothetical protein
MRTYTDVSTSIKRISDLVDKCTDGLSDQEVGYIELFDEIAKNRKYVFDIPDSLKFREVCWYALQQFHKEGWKDASYYNYKLFGVPLWN